MEIITPEASDIARHQWSRDVQIRLRSSAGEILYAADTARIKGRGNSTWEKAKKPYAIKLPRRTSLLGMPAHREWVMLANVMDHSHLRNALAFEIARRTSLDWTPQGRFVQLTLNGEGKGLYYLCESPSLSAGGSASDCTVLTEWDSHKPGGVEITLAGGGHPKDWRSVVRPQSLSLDTLSLVDWLLVNELAMNAEPFGPRSCYLHITQSGVLRAGPVWDYDLAFNEVGIDTANNLCPTRFRGQRTSVRWLDVRSSYCLESGFIELLQREGFNIPSRAELRHLMALRWKQLRPKMEELTAFIDETDKLIRQVAAVDQRRWNTADPARFDPSTSYPEAVQRLHELYQSRLRQMDKLLQ